VKGGGGGARVTAVVPTLGKSPVLRECLTALRREGGPDLHLLLIEQGAMPADLPADLDVERLRSTDALGFARAVNLGLSSARTPWVAVVNDDAVVGASWLEALLDALERAPSAAAAQGVNLDGAETRIDGCGLTWNERWQAVQILHGRPAGEAPSEDREIFGVSATAAVYRRAALESVAERGEVFDSRLDSYYEDADLACRLRAAGHSALLIASARCRHLGSSSSSESARLALVYRNRYGVLARVLGHGFWPRLPLFVLRDLAALVGAVVRGERARAAAIARGLAAAPLRVADFASLRAPLLEARDLERSAALLPRARGASTLTSAHGSGEISTSHVRTPETSFPMQSTATTTDTAPLLEGLVVHWRSPRALDRLLTSWPADSRYGLIVVDNSGELTVESREGLRILRPGANLGFAGGVNRALEMARAPYVLLLNPDAHPHAGAVEQMARALDAHPEWAGAAPRLVGENGDLQYEWQLRPLPRPGGLLRQVFFLRGVARARTEPLPGAAIEQPAGAALLLRRSTLLELGGLDASFFPAWFEDVDLCARLARRGLTLHYWPGAVFVHGLGGSLEALGYGAFLWIYYRNLVRYLRKHHGGAWAAAALVCLPAAALARALLLPLRRPRRAQSRRDALRGLAGLALGAATGFRAPAKLERAFAAPGR
jgi:GT2 family glycosyltransferase